MATRPTKAKIDRYNELLAEQKKLRRLASDLNGELDDLEEQFMSYVNERGGKARSVVTCGHILAIAVKAGTVAWKKEFVRVSGSAAAETLIADAPRKEVLTVKAVA